MTKQNSTKGKIGSSLDALLDEEGIRAEVESGAIKAIIADHPSRAMQNEGVRYQASPE